MAFYPFGETYTTSLDADLKPVANIAIGVVVLHVFTCVVVMLETEATTAPLLLRRN